MRYPWKRGLCPHLVVEKVGGPFMSLFEPVCLKEVLLWLFYHSEL